MVHRFIVSSDRENSNLIHTAREVNDGKPRWVIGKVREALADRQRPVGAALGLAVKAQVVVAVRQPMVARIQVAVAVVARKRAIVTVVAVRV